MGDGSNGSAGACWSLSRSLRCLHGPGMVPIPAMLHLLFLQKAATAYVLAN